MVERFFIILPLDLEANNIIIIIIRTKQISSNVPNGFKKENDFVGGRCLPFSSDHDFE